MIKIHEKNIKKSIIIFKISLILEIEGFFFYKYLFLAWKGIKLV